MTSGSTKKLGIQTSQNVKINNVYVEALVLEEAEFRFGCVESEVMQQVENERIMKILFLLLALLLLSLPASHLCAFIL